MPTPKPLLNWDDDESGDSDPFEEKVFGLLRDAMQRSDAAAKAIARIERLLYEQRIETQEQPTLDPKKLTEQDGITTTVRNAEEGSGGEFDQSGFYDVFMGVNTMKLVRSLLNLLDMSHIEEEVMSTIISSTFGRPPANTGQRTEIAGSEMELMLNEIKRQAIRKERQKNR